MADKVVQISVSSSSDKEESRLYALTEGGRVFVISLGHGGWKEIPVPPNCVTC